MPRLPRVHVEGCIYYVTSKGTENQRIFQEKADFKMYLDLLTKCKGQHGFKLFSYGLLSDRLSLLIEPGPDSTLSEIMQNLNSVYTKYFNARYDRRGPLFESRFKSVYVEKSAYLGSLTRRVHRLATSEQDAQTSYESYIADKPAVELPDLSGEVREVLDSLKLDRSAYVQYCASETAEEAASLEKRLGRGSMLGSEAFIEDVKRRVQEAIETRSEETSIWTPRRRFIAGIVALVATVAMVSSIYFYVSRERLKAHYETVVLQMQETLETSSPLAAVPREGETR